jgi:two-component system CheB/CheR fusion protein
VSPAASGSESDAVRDWLWAFAQQSLDYAILLVDAEQRVQWTSPGAAWILAATSAEIAGGPVARFFTPEDRATGIPDQEVLIAQRKGSSSDDRWMLRADGSRFWASGRTIALRRRDGSPLGLLKIFRDQTETRMRISHLGNHAQALAVGYAARMDAMAALVRELRAVLAPATPAATPSHGGDADGTGAGAAPHPHTDIARALGVLADMERALRAEGAPVELDIVPLQLDVELAAALDSACQRIPPQQRRIELLLPPGLPITFEGDRLQLQQVFETLICNAMRFTASDGHVWISGTVEARQVVIRVEDNGVGIDTARIESIFAILTHPAPAATGDGAGAGLALVRTVVERHGGSVQARSAGAGKGSQLTVRLPLRHPPVLPAAAGR